MAIYLQTTEKGLPLVGPCVSKKKMPRGSSTLTGEKCPQKFEVETLE